MQPGGYSEHPPATPAQVMCQIRRATIVIQSCPSPPAMLAVLVFEFALPRHTSSISHRRFSCIPLQASPAVAPLRGGVELYLEEWEFAPAGCSNQPCPNAALSESTEALASKGACR